MINSFKCLWSKEQMSKIPKESKRRNRSEQYQWTILETPCANEMMEAYSNQESIYDRLNPYAYSEELLDLEDKLKVEFWRVVESCLTARQKQVVKLSSDGYTQMEIAKLLGVNQSSITKSLNGNVDYKNGRKVYGGTITKLQKIMHKDTKIKEILARIDQIRENKW